MYYNVMYTQVYLFSPLFRTRIVCFHVFIPALFPYLLQVHLYMKLILEKSFALSI